MPSDMGKLLWHGGGLGILRPLHPLLENPQLFAARFEEWFFGCAAKCRWEVELVH